MATTIIAKVLGQTTGDTPDLIGFEVKYTFSNDGTNQFIAQVPSELTDTEMESVIRQQTAEHATANNTFGETYVESDVRGGKI